MQVSEEYKKEHGLTPEAIANTMISFYQKVDELSDSIVKKLEDRGIKLKCQAGCCHCCQDGLSVSQSELAVIKKLYPDMSNWKAHEEGGCAFLDEKGLCRIYEARPFICRTHGLPLRWNSEDGQSEERDICEFNEKVCDILKLPRECCCSCETAEMQMGVMELCTFGESIRIPLRSLFDR